MVKLHQIIIDMKYETKVLRHYAEHYHTGNVMACVINYERITKELEQYENSRQLHQES